MHTLWIVLDRLGPLLVVLALFAPFVGVAVGAVVGSRRMSQSGEYQTGRMALAGFGGGVILAPVLLWFSCAPPGEGESARRGYERGAPVLAALEAFHKASGAYPDSLRQLVPRFLSAEAVAPPAIAGQQYPFEYHRDGPTYVLTFRYVRPGMNTCTYRGAAHAWSCGGLY